MTLAGTRKSRIDRTRSTRSSTGAASASGEGPTASARRSSGPRCTGRRSPLLLLFFCVCAVLALALAGCADSPEEKLAEVRELQLVGRIQESVPILIDLIESGHRDGEILLRYGRALSLLGENGRSVWAFDAAREYEDFFVLASHELASIAFRTRNFDFALEVLGRLRDERPDAFEDDLSLRLLEVRTLVRIRRMNERALERLDALLEDFPEEEEAIRLKAVVLLEEKRTDEAYDLIRQADIQVSELHADGTEYEDGGEAEEGEAEPTDLADRETREAYWCLVRASFKREAGEMDEAVEVVEECLERFPTDAPLINEAVKLFSGLGRFDRVLDVLRRANEQDPLDVEIRSALVQHLDGIGFEAEAEQLLRDAIETTEAEHGPDTIPLAAAWVDLGAYLVDQERAADALDAYAAAMEILGDRASPALLFRQAEAMIFAGRLDEALAVAEKTPVEVHQLMVRGRVAYERREYEQALEHFEAAALQWPDNAPTRFYLARAAEALGLFDKAIEEYRQAMRADAGLAAARERLARLHLAEGRVRDALTILEFVSPRKRSAPSTKARLLEIEAQARAGREPNMAIAPTADWPLDELQRAALAALARGLSARHDLATAESTLAELQKLVTPRERGVFVRERVELLVAAGEEEQALELAQQALEETPQNEHVRVALVRALVASGSDALRARVLLEAIRERRPTDVDLLTSLGQLERVEGKVEAALEAYAEALEAEPDHWPAARARTKLLVESGRRAEAIAELEDYLETADPYRGEAALALLELLDEAEGEEAGEEAGKQRRLELASRAVRFGGGDAALDRLRELDPSAAESAQAARPTRPAAKDAPASPGPG